MESCDWSYIKVCRWSHVKEYTLTAVCGWSHVTGHTLAGVWMGAMWSREVMGNSMPLPLRSW